MHQPRAEVTLGDDFYNAAGSHSTGGTVEEAMESIEGASSYAMLRNPGVDPEFGEFLDPLWEEIRLLVDPLDPGRAEHMSFVFEASPRAITPFHIDRVANSHMQIRPSLKSRPRVVERVTPLLGPSAAQSRLLVATTSRSRGLRA